MADTNYYATKYHKQNQANPTKFYSHFLYKALIATIFLVILPLFPSQAPEFINQTLNTRGWEFLHLIFVGIAVSYGLFGRKNDESEKDNNTNSKFDNAQTYVSRFLQVSSVFDDETDHNSPPRSEGSSTVQTWNNQYYRNDPVVVVADHDHSQEQRGSSSRLVEKEKPLLLPVRSLKSRVLDVGDNRSETCRESFCVSANSLTRSNSNLGSKRISSIDDNNNLKENVFLPSPIPWRSRSGRLELKESKEDKDSPSSMEKSEINRPFRAQTSPKLSSSPKKFSAETQGKIAEDLVRKKSIYRSPPPPPPPQPQLLGNARNGSLSIQKSGRTNRSNELKEKEVDEKWASKTQKVTFMEDPKEEKEELVEKIVMESEEEEEEEEEISFGSKNVGEVCSSDVNKKADEFIAKFREQIRLQRIESIKRSSGQINRKNVR